jgi:hypothetical protein
VNPNVRLSILLLLALGWFVLAVVNVAKGHPVVGGSYAACGAIISIMTYRLSKGRRSR